VKITSYDLYDMDDHLIRIVEGHELESISESYLARTNSIKIHLGSYIFLQCPIKEDFEKYVRSNDFYDKVSKGIYLSKSAKMYLYRRTSDRVRLMINLKLIGEI